MVVGGGMGGGGGKKGVRPLGDVPSPRRLAVFTRSGLKLSPGRRIVLSLKVKKKKKRKKKKEKTHPPSHLLNHKNTREKFSRTYPLFRDFLPRLLRNFSDIVAMVFVLFFAMVDALVNGLHPKNFYDDFEIL